MKAISIEVDPDCGDNVTIASELSLVCSRHSGLLVVASWGFPEKRQVCVRMPPSFAHVAGL